MKGLRRLAVVMLCGLWLVGPADAESMSDSALTEVRQQLMQAAYQAELSGDPNYDFANLMVAHQGAGIDMAKALLDSSEDERLVRVAELIIDNHEREIEDLNTWLERYDEPSPEDDAEAVRQAYRAVLDGLAEDRDEFRVQGDADSVFANAMIWHHELAVALGQVMLNHSVDAQLRILAGDIVRDSTRDIAELRNWMRTREAD